MKTKTTKFKARKVDGKTQRAKTYKPGEDVVCVRGSIALIDKIRAEGKKAGSISKYIAGLIGGGKPKSKTKKKSSAKKAAPIVVKAASNHAPKLPAEAKPAPQAAA